MLAVEFETHVKNGMIQIPEKYREMAEGLLKIIILKQEQKTIVSSRNKCPHLKKLLTQIRRKNIFQAINDPVEWQREIRDEWS
ncbi:MAG TPA: hypothetical protein VK469_11710 [Candidatus Kapabacteria bacterium]|nr:hypothetical protein [Candidatus Kapabacteria bacterium]